MNYEMMIIAPPHAGDSAEAKIKEVVLKFGGEIVQMKALGERELAYPIKKLRTGHYYLYDLSLSKDAVAKMNTLFNLSPEVLRALIVRKEVSKKIATPRKEPVIAIKKEPAVEIEETSPAEIKKDIDLELGL
jgi:small subunit ribosomal protein S6